MRLLLLLAFLAPAALAQTVSSITFRSSQTMDGLYVDEVTGELFAVGGFIGTNVYSIEPAGGLSVFATGLTGPIHLTRAPDGNYYVTEFTPLNTQNGTVSLVTPTGEVTEFAVVPAGPSDIVADAEGNLYVSQFGIVSNDPSTNGNGDSITKITTDGTVSVFSAGGLLAAPVGLDFDDEGNLYAANIFDGLIVKMTPDGTQSLFASLPVTAPFTIGHLVWSNGRLYATHLGANQIHVFERDGTGRVLAGSGENGRQDGPAAEATFSSPNGIAASVTGDTLYVSEYIGAVNRIRMITLNGAVSTEPDAQDMGLELQHYPNPIADAAQITYALDAPAEATLTVYDALGRTVARLAEGMHATGRHAVRWDRAAQPAGLYVLRLQVGTDAVIRRMIVQ
ncbi:MAG: T9SS type A sorting domain-containing protein [Bacteroidota bacterium]